MPIVYVVNLECEHQIVMKVKKLDMFAIVGTYHLCCSCNRGQLITSVEKLS